MRESGNIIRLPERVFSCILQAMSILATGQTTNQMGLVNTRNKMVPAMKVTGRTISSMAKE